MNKNLKLRINEALGIPGLFDFDLWMDFVDIHDGRQGSYIGSPVTCMIDGWLVDTTYKDILQEVDHAERIEKIFYS